MVADLEVGKVADKVADKAADMATDKKTKLMCARKRSWCMHENKVYWAKAV